jgi:aryl-alcohol dehydrogenase-like predicted oxidoreductase
MTLPPASPRKKALALGTALWGRGISRATAHALLDRFVELDGRTVDTATN